MLTRTPARRSSQRWGDGVRVLLLAVALAVQHASVSAAELKVAVAANFLPVAQTLLPGFTAESGHAVRLSAASSGTLYAQIRNGAPFDVFLSADLMRPQKLLDAGLGDTGFVYARGVLVLFAPQQALPPRLEEALRAPDLRFLAVANPRTAPYGAAAAEVLAALEATQPLTVRRVVGSSIGQTFQYVLTGNAELGLVAWSQVLALPAPVSSRHVMRIDPQRYSALEQGGVILQRTRERAAAEDFVGFLVREDTQERIAHAGYLRPDRQHFP